MIPNPWPFFQTKWFNDAMVVEAKSKSISYKALSFIFGKRKLLGQSQWLQEPCACSAERSIILRFGKLTMTCNLEAWFR